MRQLWQAFLMKTKELFYYPLLIFMLICFQEMFLNFNSVSKLEHISEFSIMIMKYVLSHVASRKNLCYF